MITLTESPVKVNKSVEDNYGTCKGCGVTWEKGKPHIIQLPCLVRCAWVGREGRGWHILWPCNGMFPYCEKCHVKLNKLQKLRCIAILVGSWCSSRGWDSRGLRDKLWYITQFCKAAVKVGFFDT